MGLSMLAGSLSSNKKLVGTSASLLVTSALLVVTSATLLGTGALLVVTRTLLALLLRSLHDQSMRSQGLA